MAGGALLASQGGTQRGGLPSALAKDGVFPPPQGVRVIPPVADGHRVQRRQQQQEEEAANKARLAAAMEQVGCLPWDCVASLSGACEVTRGSMGWGLLAASPVLRLTRPRHLSPFVEPRASSW